MFLNNNKLPLVSIFMPAYNHEKYVQEAIQSVIDQDYPRIELIVIDDGSKDDTWAKIEAMRSVAEKRFERIVFKTRPNAGCAATCRECLATTRGEFVGDMASDDMYLPKAISTLLNGFDSPDVGLVCGINEYMDSESHHCYVGANGDNVYTENDAVDITFNDTIRRNTGVSETDKGFGTYGALVNGNHVPNGYLMRKQHLDLIDAYSENAPLEDWWLHLQLSKVAKYRFVSSPVFRYRRHGANTVRDIGRLCALYNKTGKFEIETLKNMPDRDGAEFRCLFDEGSHVVEDVFSIPHFVRVEKRYITSGIEYRLCVGRHVLFRI